MRRVAVTGIGLVSPLGHDAYAVFDAACAGRSGVGPLDIAGAHRLTAPLAATVKFDGTEYFEPLQFRLLDRVSQFAVVAARRALADARCDLSDAERVLAGVFLGTGMGGTITIDDGYQTLYGEQSDRIRPMMVLKGMHNAPAAWIGIEHQLRGPNLTYSTACSSSSVAIGEAWLRLACGTLDVAVAGGALEFVLSLLALKHRVALPTMHLLEPDPQCDLDYVANVARAGASGRTMLSNSFAFGGTNSVLALRAAH